jgi:integrase
MTYLVRQGNIWYVELTVPKDVRSLFPTCRTSTDLNVIGRAKFSKSLKTQDKKIAKIRSYKYLSLWQTQILEAKENGTVFPKIDTVDTASKINDTAVFTSTSSYIAQWLDYHCYSPSVRLAAKSFLEKKFCKKFLTFEEISLEKLTDWLNSQCIHEDASKISLDRVRLMKKANFINKYWSFCEKKMGGPANIMHGQIILPNLIGIHKTKINSRNSSYRFFTSDECKKLILAAIATGDKNLLICILMGMYTGCRLGEICNLKVDHVTDSSIQIEDSKTYSGIRSIPIHPQIYDVIKISRANSSDGYLLSNLSCNNSVKDRGKGMSHRFRRLKNSLNFKDRYGFHSFRSTFAHKLEAANIPEIVASRLMGHKINTMSYGLYSGSGDWGTLEATIGVVDYDLDQGLHEKILANIC